MVISSLKGILANWNPEIFKITDYRFSNHVIILDNEEAKRLLEALQEYINQSRIPSVDGNSKDDNDA